MLHLTASCEDCDDALATSRLAGHAIEALLEKNGWTTIESVVSPDKHYCPACWADRLKAKAEKEAAHA